MKSGGQLGGVGGEIRWTVRSGWWNQVGIYATVQESRLGVLTRMVKRDLFWFMWQTDNHHPLQPLFGSKFFSFVLQTETTQSLLYFFSFVLHIETTQSLLYFFSFMLNTETTQSLLYFSTNSDPPNPPAEGRKSWVQQEKTPWVIHGGPKGAHLHQSPPWNVNKSNCCDKWETKLNWCRLEY